MQAWHDACKTCGCGEEEDNWRGQASVRRSIWHLSRLLVRALKRTGIIFPTKLPPSLLPNISKLHICTDMAEEENEEDVVPDVRVFLVVKYPMESYPKGDISAIYR